MTIYKDKMKNVVLSLDRGFRTQASRLFGDAGFPGEKIFVGNASEATAILRFDRLALNICVSPDNLETPAYLEILANINTVVAGSSILTLAYFRLDQARELNEVKAGLPYLNLRLLPIKRADFISVFRSLRGISVEGFRPPEIQSGGKFEGPDRQKKLAKEGSVLSFFEATKHLRESIDAVNELHKDSGHLDLLHRIGQRFNGLVGAYCFFQNQAGFKELFHLSVVVDDISRHYDGTSATAMDPQHLNLLTDAVRAAFVILKRLRDGLDPEPAQTEEAMRIFESFQNDSTITKRERSSQDEVEALLQQFGTG